MKTLKLINGDLVFNSRNNLEMVKEKQEVVQRVKVELSVNKGEWIFNKLFGVPWIELMRDKEKGERDYEREVLKVLKEDKEVVNESIEINVNYDELERVMNIDFIAKLTNGDLIEEQVGIEV